MTHARPYLLIDGERIGPDRRGTRPVLDPATAQPIAAVPVATPDDIAAAAAAAGRAFPAWRATASHRRQEILRGAAAALRLRREEGALLITAEQGKPLAEARVEVDVAAETLEWFADEARRSYGRLIPSRLAGHRQVVEIEPVGPVAAFAPWNFPMVNAVRKIAPALAAGCTVVAKPAEETPGAPLLLAECLIGAGVPDGALNLVYGEPAAISDALIRAPAIRKISFTGSVPVGKSLAALAAQQGKRATMELGGHAPVIILDDADPVRVAELAALAKFRNAGQVCNSATRFYVQRRIYAAFLAAFSRQAGAITVGNGRDLATRMGPLANERRVAAMRRFVEDARRLGGGVVGGMRTGEAGFYFRPTILHDVPDAAQAWREEPFGPLALVAPFDDPDEALHRANDISVGLSSFVFTESARRQRHLIDGLQAGLVGVNTFTVSFPETPFGGVKESGYGYEGGMEGLEPYTIRKFVHVA